MLTRNCGEQIAELLDKGNFNVRITVADKSSTGWKEVFRDSLGGGIIHSLEDYVVSCKAQDYDLEFKSIGREIMDSCWRIIKDSNVVRINITKLPIEKNKPHSWIIARD